MSLKGFLLIVVVRGCVLQKRNEKKVKSEELYYQSKTYVNGD